MMSDNINKKELAQRVAKRLGYDPKAVEPIVDATIEEIVESLRQGQGVTLRNFGTFYIKEKYSGTVFKFNPSQRLRAIFGWSSTYKGKDKKVLVIDGTKSDTSSLDS